MFNVMSDLKKDIDFIQNIEKNINEINKDKNTLLEENKYELKRIAKSIENQFNDEKISMIKPKIFNKQEKNFFKRIISKIFKL